MYFYFSKIAQEFLYPLNITLILMIVGLLATWKKRPRLVIGSFATAFLLLLLCSMPVVSELLLSPIESAHPTVPINSCPKADVIITLGGSLAPSYFTKEVPEEQTGSRLLPTLKLYQSGKAPKIIVTGGVPYLDSKGVGHTEAGDMKAFLTYYGVPSQDIIEENRSRTTYENVLFTKEILAQEGYQKILLVTHAFHMKRAVNLFKKQGIEVIPFPVSFFTQGIHSKGGWLPYPWSLQLSTHAIKEIVGNIVLH